jgi:Mrp family chromosome partitioning ATPase
VLQRGQLRDTAPEFFEQESVKVMMRELMRSYDLIFVDVPPLMQVAYTSTIAALFKNAVLVIRSGTSLDSAQDLVRRSRFMGIEILGYLYNSGGSDELRPFKGSLSNVLGDSEPGAPVGSHPEPID